LVTSVDPAASRYASSILMVNLGERRRISASDEKKWVLRAATYA
jgi:hypothetical protein